MFKRCTILRLLALCFTLAGPAPGRCRRLVHSRSKHTLGNCHLINTGPPHAPVIHLGARGAPLSARSAFISHGAPGPPRFHSRAMRLFERRKYRLKIRAGGQFRIKPKTNHSVAKRFKITATGKLMFRRASTQHRQRHKSRGARARLHRRGILTSVRMIRKIKGVLHNR